MTQTVVHIANTYIKVSKFSKVAAVKTKQRAERSLNTHIDLRGTAQHSLWVRHYKQPMTHSH